MIVIVRSVKVEDYRNIVFCKVPVVGTIVDSVWVVLIVVSIIKIQVCVGCVGVFRNLVNNSD